jgi:hypothetical protein
MRVFWTPQRVLQIADNPNASGKLPVKHFTWYKAPLAIEGIGLYDMEKDGNQAMDHALKYTLDNSNRSQVKIIYKASAITNMEDALDNEAHGMIGVNTDYSLDDAIKIVPAAPIAEAQVSAIRLIQDLQEQMTGTAMMKQPNAAPRDVSGRAIEGMQAPTQNRMDRIKKRWHKFMKDCIRDVIFNTIEYEDKETTVVLGRDWNEEHYIDFDPSILRFDEQTFEAKWDIVIDEPKNMPINPVDKIHYMIEIMKLVGDMPPERAKAIIQSMEIPKEAIIERVLDDEIAAQADQPPPPTEMDILQAQAQMQQQQIQMQAQADQQTAQMESQLRIEEADRKAVIEQKLERDKMELKVLGRAAESVADAMEKVAQTVATAGNMEGSIEIIQLIPIAVKEALSGTPIDENKTYQQAQGIGQIQ